MIFNFGIGILKREIKHHYKPESLSFPLNSVLYWLHVKNQRVFGKMGKCRPYLFKEGTKVADE